MPMCQYPKPTKFSDTEFNHRMAVSEDWKPGSLQAIKIPKSTLFYFRTYINMVENEDDCKETLPTIVWFYIYI